MIEKKEFDLKEANMEVKNLTEKWNELYKVGDVFVNDKKTIEEQISKIEAAAISSEDKKELLKELQNSLKVLEEQYKKEVITNQEKIKGELDKKVAEIGEAEDDWMEQAANVEALAMEKATDVNFTNAHSKAQEKIETLKKLREHILERKEDFTSDGDAQSSKVKVLKKTL